MKNIKKLIAGVSVLALVAMNALTTNWANANPTFAYANWTDTVAWTADDVVTVTIPATVTWADGNRVIVSIKDDAGDNVNLTWKIANVTNGANNAWASNLANWIYAIDVTTAATPVTFEFTPWVVWNFWVSITWTAWFGSAVTYVGGANLVQVTGYVLPILAMDLSSNTIDFGELVPWVANNKTVDVVTESNAKDGITVSVAATWLATWWTASDKYIWNLARASATATSASDSYQIASSTTAWGTVITTTNVASTQNVLTTAGVAASNATTTVTLSATATAQTEAWNYNDTLTFTVTGTF